MKKAKKIPFIPPLAPDATDEEVVAWVTRYDLDDRLAAGVSEIVEIYEPLTNQGKKKKRRVRNEPMDNRSR